MLWGPLSLGLLLFGVKSALRVRHGVVTVRREGNDYGNRRAATQSLDHQEALLPVPVDLTSFGNTVSADDETKMKSLGRALTPFDWHP